MKTVPSGEGCATRVKAAKAATLLKAVVPELPVSAAGVPLFLAMAALLPPIFLGVYVVPFSHQPSATPDMWVTKTS